MARRTSKRLDSRSQLLIFTSTVVICAVLSVCITISNAIRGGTSSNLATTPTSVATQVIYKMEDEVALGDGGLAVKVLKMETQDQLGGQYTDRNGSHGFWSSDPVQAPNGKTFLLLWLDVSNRGSAVFNSSASSNPSVVRLFEPTLIDKSGNTYLEATACPSRPCSDSPYRDEGFAQAGIEKVFDLAPELKPGQTITVLATFAVSKKSSPATLVIKDVMGSSSQPLQVMIDLTSPNQ